MRQCLTLHLVRGHGVQVHSFPEGAGRGDSYNPHLKKLERLVEEAEGAVQIKLNAEEVSRLEKLGDETGVRTLREWEKEM